MDNDMFDEIYNNIDEIIIKYDHILNPQVNYLTKFYLLEHNDVKLAYAQTFCTLLEMYGNVYQ